MKNRKLYTVNWIEAVEDSGGGLYLFAFNANGDVIAGFSGLEYGGTDGMEPTIREALLNGVSDWDNAIEDPRETYNELEEFRMAGLGCCIVADAGFDDVGVAVIDTYPARFGGAAAEWKKQGDEFIAKR